MVSDCGTVVRVLWVVCLPNGSCAQRMGADQFVSGVVELAEDRCFRAIICEVGRAIERGQRFTDMFVSITVPTLAFTEVDLSLVIQSASTLTPYGRSERSLPLTPSPSRPPSLVEDAPEEAVISAIAPAMAPLESPSRASAIASSHNSFESNFDSNRLVFPPDPWPRTPRLIPARLPHGHSSHMVGYDPERLVKGWFDAEAPVPPMAYVRSCSADVFGKLESENLKRQAIYVTVRET